MINRYKSKLLLLVCLTLCQAAVGYAVEQWDAKASARVNLRKSPSLNGEILGTIPNGHPVNILQTKGSWCKVDVSGEITGRGWVYARYLERINLKTPELKNIPIDKPQVEAPRVVELVHMPPAKLPYYRFTHEAPEITGRDSSAQTEPGDSIVSPKSTPDVNENPVADALKSIPAVSAKSAPAARVMATPVKKAIVPHETKDLTFNRQSIRPFKIALKMVSILLYCLVIILLYKEK